MSLRIYNTLTGQKEDFIPLKPGKIGMYVCGVTVYDYCHVGHARVTVVFDTVYRYLQCKGFDVTYVRNFTDIDDKIINRAKEEGVPWTDVAAKYTDAFHADMEALNCLAPSVEPKATQYIGDMITLIQTLIASNKAYTLEGDVYFSVSEFETYGRLSGKNIKNLIAGSRVEVDERKQNPLDFALWKSAKQGEPAWNSPWGKGRPGWHIECSAMSSKVLGTQFDIHGGGKDLVFPHHENEIAQSQSANNCSPVKYWVHNGFVNINKEKMSKSLGNFFTLREIYQHFLPETLRYFLLTVHYRSPIDFSQQNLEEAEKVLGRFYEFLRQAEKVREKIKGLTENEVRPSTQLLEKFEEAMDDDFNTALVIGHLNDELRHLNKLLVELQHTKDIKAWEVFAEELAAFRQVGTSLGLFGRNAEEYRKRELEKQIKNLNLDVQKIESLIAERNIARESKDWVKADICRKTLVTMGVLLEDTPEGTLWKLK